MENSDNDMGMAKENEVIPMDQNNEWLQTLNGKIRGGHSPFKATKQGPKYRYPVKVSNRQQRGIRHG